MPSEISRPATEASSFSLGRADGDFQVALDAWDDERNSERLWNADPSLFTSSGEEQWLGWLGAVEASHEQLPVLRRLAEEVRGDGIRDVVVMGMGGSSLCPDVFARTFPARPGWPRLHVIDTTVPAQIRRQRAEIELETSLFIVPSKSGTTIEPDSLQRRFLADMSSAVSEQKAGARFVAITDPGSPLQEEAKRAGFRQVLEGTPSIGGRFSALSVFGLAPASFAGLDVDGLLARAEQMKNACGPEVPSAQNPGAALGIALATLARGGRDKLTLVISPGIAALGGWLEQLVAESTGKQGAGIIPVADEPTLAPERYGEDRVFVYLRLQDDPSEEQDRAVADLEASGHPVIRLALADRLDLGAEFFRWEFATAVAGALLGINPFDQPDVEAAKIEARQLMEHFEETGTLPVEEPICQAPGAQLFADPTLSAAADLSAQLALHLERLVPGDYFAINAFLDMSEANQSALERIRRAALEGLGVATTVGFGPRFLHSTGQLHKGGPASGLFLQITSEDDSDIDIPGRGFSFGVLKHAQSVGDFRVLSQRGRRILRVHLDDSREERIQELASTFENIFAGIPESAEGEPT